MKTETSEEKYLKLQQAYDKLLQIDKQRDQLRLIDEEIRHSKSQEHKQKLESERIHNMKIFLQNQMNETKKRKDMLSNEERAHFYKTQVMFKKDPTLQVLHPQIHELPEYIKLEQTRKIQKLTAKNLDEQAQYKQQEMQKSNENFKREYNQLANQAIQHQVERESQEQAKRRQLLENVQTVRKEQIKAKEFKQIIGDETKILQDTIIFGELSHETPAQIVKIDQHAEQKDRIIKKLRKQADERASQFQLIPKRPYQYMEQEIDPMPELPLANVILGSPQIASQWVTSYNQSYQDPKKELEEFYKGVEAVKNDCVDKYILDKIENDMDVAVQSVEATLLSEQSQDEVEHDDFDLATAQFKTLATPSKISYKSYASTTTKRKKNLDIFEARPAPKISNEDPVTKQLLDQELKSPNMEDAKSVVIKKRIAEAVYRKKMNRVSDVQLSQAQTKAQQDALSRMINKIQSQVIQDKRIAEQARKKNRDYDLLKQMKMQKSKVTEQELQSQILQQVRSKQSALLQKAFFDRSVPDIQGDLGYPKIFVKSNEMEKKDILNQTSKNRRDLKQQIRLQRNQQSAQKLTEAKLDQDYLDEFRVVERQCDIKHTTGNVGKIGSLSKEYFDNLQTQENKIAEQWQIELRLKQAQSQLQKQTGLIVTAEKLDQVVTQAEQDVKKLNQSLNCTNGLFDRISQRIEQKSAASTKKSTKRDADTESIWTKYAQETAEQDRRDQLQMMVAMERNRRQKSVQQMHRNSKSGRDLMVRSFKTKNSAPWISQEFENQ